MSMIRSDWKGKDTVHAASFQILHAFFLGIRVASRFFPFLCIPSCSVLSGSVSLCLVLSCLVLSCLCFVLFYFCSVPVSLLLLSDWGRIDDSLRNPSDCGGRTPAGAVVEEGASCFGRPFSTARFGLSARALRACGGCVRVRASFPGRGWCVVRRSACSGTCGRGVCVGDVCAGISEKFS